MPSSEPENPWNCPVKALNDSQRKGIRQYLDDTSNYGSAARIREQRLGELETASKDGVRVIAS